MNLLKFFNVPAFLISFAIGMFIVYVTLDDTRKIYVYPTPENVELMQYKDKTESCFEYRQKEVECPADESMVSKIMAQV